MLFILVKTLLLLVEAILLLVGVSNCFHLGGSVIVTNAKHSYYSRKVFLYLFLCMYIYVKCILYHVTCVRFELVKSPEVTLCS